MSDSAVVPSTSRVLRAGGRSYPLLLPSWRDPRLHVAAVLVSVQILGQVALDFELSIVQILTSLLTCAVIEVAITFWRQRVIAWPASALLTGNGVALILRVNGTEHGDWWSTKGLWIFAATAAVSLLSKYVIRVDARPLFNPSNIGLVACFLILGRDRVNPLDFWWGPLTIGLGVAYCAIVLGGLAITARIRLAGVAVTFWVTFAAALGIVAVAGHCMTARWQLTPVCGAAFWWKLVTSPEILIFAFFMITDPRTAPLGRRARLAFGALVGFVAAVLVAPMGTELSSKVAVLAALVVVCALRPLLERALRDPVAVDADLDDVDVVPPRRSIAARAPAIGALVAVASAGLVFAGLPARPESASAGAEPLPNGELFVETPDVPVVERDESVDTITGGISQVMAQQIGGDLAFDLALEAEALRTGDAGLVAGVLSGPRRDAIETAIAAGSIEPVSYQLDSLTVRVIRRPTPQSAPRIAVHVIGRAGSEPLDTLYVVAEIGDRYLIADEVEP